MNKRCQLNAVGFTDVRTRPNCNREKCALFTFSGLDCHNINLNSMGDHENKSLTTRMQEPQRWFIEVSSDRG